VIFIVRNVPFHTLWWSNENKKKEKKMNIRSKAGFTLIELMVVAIIVAILAAVAIPLLSANRNRAYATEGQAGCGTIKTAIRVMQADNATAPAIGSIASNNVRGVSTTDLEGTYFAGNGYVLTSFTSYDNYVVTATASKNNAAGTVIMTVTAGAAAFTGTLLQ
jgi:prepilin-type N-terminal cleavage/methylation domain-containing protein